MRSIQLFIEDQTPIAGLNGFTRSVTGLFIGMPKNFNSDSLTSLQDRVRATLGGEPEHSGTMLVTGTAGAPERVLEAIDTECNSEQIEVGAAFSVEVVGEGDLEPHWVSVADGPHDEEAILAVRMTRSLTARDPLMRVANHTHNS